MLVLICSILCGTLTFVSATGTSAAASLASQFSLTTSTALPFPTSTQSNADTQAFITDRWSLSNGEIQQGSSDITFVDDPFPNSSVPGSNSTSGPVLQVTYPAGSYSHGTGGAQWYTLWNTSDGSAFNSMILSYEVAFDPGFNWVKGGKLPGLRGGPDMFDCSGGQQPNGTDCFSARAMWRGGGQGEIYAYVLRPDGYCSQPNIICNPDYGISIARGAFAFAPGQWSRITLLIQLNNPVDSANGNAMLFFNDVEVISQQNLQLRAGSDVDIGGLFFSTFFGGGDSSYATPTNTHSYFRNIQMWGSSFPSNSTVSTTTGTSGGSQNMTAKNRDMMDILLSLFVFLLPYIY